MEYLHNKSWGTYYRLYFIRHILHLKDNENNFFKYRKSTGSVTVPHFGIDVFFIIIQPNFGHPACKLNFRTDSIRMLRSLNIATVKNYFKAHCAKNNTNIPIQKSSPHAGSDATFPETVNVLLQLWNAPFLWEDSVIVGTVYVRSKRQV